MFISGLLGCAVTPGKFVSWWLSANYSSSSKVRSSSDGETDTRSLFNSIRLSDSNIRMSEVGCAKVFLCSITPNKIVKHFLWFSWIEDKCTNLQKYPRATVVSNYLVTMGNHGFEFNSSKQFLARMLGTGLHFSIPRSTHWTSMPRAVFFLHTYPSSCKNPKKLVLVLAHFTLWSLKDDDTSLWRNRMMSVSEIGGC